MPRSGSARRRACSSSLARPARALAPTVEALPLMVCRVAALPWTSPLAELAFELGEEVLHIRNEAPQHPDDQLGLPPKRLDDIAPRLDQFARVRCRCRRAPGAAPAEMTEQAKHQALLVDRLRHMVVHARRQAGFAVGQRGVGGHGRDRQPGEAPVGADSGSPRDHRYPASACPSAPRRTARSPPAPAERPPARRRRGPPGRPRCSTARRRPGGSARCPPLPADARPQPLGALHRARRRVGRGALFAVQRMQHRVGQLLGRDRLGEKIDEGRRAVVARIGQHLAAIGGVITMGGGRSPCNWRISCAALRPSRSACANPSAPRRSDGPRPSPPGPAPPPRCRCRRSRRASRGRRPCVRAARRPPGCRPPPAAAAVRRPGAGRTQRLVVGDVEVQVEPEPATAARRARPAIPRSPAIRN